MNVRELPHIHFGHKMCFLFRGNVMWHSMTVDKIFYMVVNLANANVTDSSLGRNITFRNYKSISRVSEDIRFSFNDKNV